MFIWKLLLFYYILLRFLYNSYKHIVPATSNLAESFVDFAVKGFLFLGTLWRTDTEYEKRRIFLMNTNHIAILLEVESCRSISKAASNLYMSQPQVSNIIRNLEEENGFPIFVRTRSGVSLTPQGKLFLESLRAIQTEMEKISRIPEHFQEKKDLSIAAIYSRFFVSGFSALPGVVSGKRCHRLLYGGDERQRHRPGGIPSGAHRHSLAHPQLAGTSGELD